MSLFESASLVVTPNGTKASKLYAIKPTDSAGDLTVTRATTATRVNSAGLIESVASNVPRLDYTNSTCPSILVEPQRTNLFLYSEQFNNAAWTKTNTTVTANATTAPDGTTTADLIVPSNATDGILLFTNISFTSGTTYTLSLFGKKENFDFLLLAFPSSAFPTSNRIALFDLNNGTIASATQSGTNAVITNYNNGWYKCSISITATTTTTGNIVFAARSSNNLASLGNGTDGLYLWGAQLEAGSNATSYIPTTTASVTRNADVISKTGISSLIGQTEGTLFVHFNKNYSAASERYIALGDGTSSNRIMIIGGTGGSIRGFIQNGGTTQFDISTGTAVGNYKIALSYKNNDIAFYINGVQVSLDNIATIPSTSNLYLGSHETGLTEYLNGFINSAAIWKTRLSNSELATLTTL